ncbi:MAG: hypothetical protein ACE5IJ_04855 [Thermoplasmata archaeon]
MPMSGESSHHNSGTPVSSPEKSSAKKRFKAKLYQALATLNYNSERAQPVEAVLKNFLLTRDTSIDIAQEVRRIRAGELAEMKLTVKQSPAEAEQIMKSHWFRQECVLASNIQHEYIPECVLGKFGPFADEFEASAGFNLNALWMLSFKFARIYGFQEVRNPIQGREIQVQLQRGIDGSGFRQGP